jgi:S1-C subfamily serine protease
MERALNFLTEAKATSNEGQQLELLQSALKSLNAASNSGKWSAIKLVQSAITALQAHDSKGVSADIAKAIAVINGPTPASPPASPGVVNTGTPPSSSSEPEHPAAVVPLTENQARAIVLIKGDNEEGTGFLVKMPDGPVVITNIHVISNNPNLQITTNSGAPITILSYKGATDRDLAMIAIKDGNYSYLALAADISDMVRAGDEVITAGNSEGGGVMLSTGGKLLGIGPDRIEFDNPVYHGNSGGPVFHLNSGKIIGVVTEAVKVDLTDEVDKASFSNRNSAIGHLVRYFGLRLDTVPNWEAYDWNTFQGETAFLDRFDKENRCLDSYINAPNDNKPEDVLWREDSRIAKANTDCFDQRSGADASQQMDAIRELWSEIRDIANTDTDTMQNLNNFYLFERQRAKDGIAYRKALQAELDQISDNVSRLASLPRTNNQ